MKTSVSVNPRLVTVWRSHVRFVKFMEFHEGCTQDVPFSNAHSSGVHLVMDKALGDSPPGTSIQRALHKHVWETRLKPLSRLDRKTLLKKRQGGELLR